MKKLLLALALSTSLVAVASPLQPSGGSIYYTNLGIDMATYSSTLNKNSIANTSEGGNGGNGGSGGNVSIKTERPLPNAPAMGASSSNTTALHRKLNQKTVSVLFGGYTSVTMDLDVISFWQTNPSEELQLAACFDGSQAYKDFKKELSQRPDSKVLACPN